MEPRGASVRLGICGRAGRAVPDRVGALSMRRTWDPTVLAMLFAVAMLVGTVAATGGLGPGQWRGDLAADQGSVRLDIRLDKGNRHMRLGTDVPSGEIEGFDAAAFARSEAPLHLSWKRDAGTLVFDGKGGRRAGGKVRFEPDATFGERWRALGFEALAEGDALRMMVHEVRLADAERLHALGYADIDVDALIRLGQEPDAMKQLEEMLAQGLHPEIDDFFRLRAYGVGAEEVRGFTSAGLRSGADDLIRLRSQGIDAEFVKGMIVAGVGADDLDGIIRLHAHGVSTDYATKIRSSGFSEVGVNDIIQLHDQGIDSDFVRGLVESHLPGMALDDIVRLHAHGVPTDYVRAVVEIGPGSRDADDVIRLHDHGVSTDFVRSLVSADRGDLSVDELIRALSRGVGSLSKPMERDEGR